MHYILFSVPIVLCNPQGQEESTWIESGQVRSVIEDANLRSDDEGACKGGGGWRWLAEVSGFLRRLSIIEMELNRSLNIVFVQDEVQVRVCLRSRCRHH